MKRTEKELKCAAPRLTTGKKRIFCRNSKFFANESRKNKRITGKALNKPNRWNKPWSIEKRVRNENKQTADYL